MTRKPKTVPSTMPRIAVSLPAEVYETIRRLSVLSGDSMSSIVGQMAVETAPVLARVADIMQSAKTAQETRLDGLRAAVSELTDRLTPLASAASAQIGTELGKLEAAVAPEAVRTGRRRRQDPRPSNTGVRSPRKHGKGGVS